MKNVCGGRCYNQRDSPQTFMEIYDLRLLQTNDIDPLLEEESQVWQDRLHWDFSGTANMIRRFMDTQILTGYAAVEGGVVAGFSFYVYQNRKGLIGDAFVRRMFRGGDTEVRLLVHVLETLEATPGIQRIEAQLINMDSPALRGFFASQRYLCYDRKFLYLALSEMGPTGKTAVPGHQIQDWESRRFLDAATLIQRAYEGHVDSVISDQYRTQAGTIRFLENIIHYPGCGQFLPAASFFTVHRATGALCGLLMTSAVCAGVAHITQVCVAPEMHGIGIGGAMLTHGLQALRRQGYHAATLSVTTTNTWATKLYGRLGFRCVNTFPAFAWDAPKGGKGSRRREASIQSR
jgi:ribosomal protein S18 acetylase RimI-like enzyme